ncbi:multiple sugar transport system permease protein [Luteococcus japonicus]|uniref:Multiple sugar transport system permease protein n=1 Tax=Luteococcus japonicus TaxID=33984 RepID=A0A3N1ZQF6_9ACTN|nr:carbohydrate ABC transporter permease [Luteococcus japonicus]ROR53140.1 multiple sugar transport system permease protein [Luteococcus japonicus]
MIVASRRGRGLQAARYALLVLLSVLFLLPFYVLVRNAFASNKLITAPRWRWLPDQVNLDNLRALFAQDNVGMVPAMWHSAVMALSQTTLTVLISLLAGYALARYDNRLSRILLGFTLFTLMVPASVTFIPMFVMTAQLGWIDSFRGLVVPGMFSAFATYMFRQSFLGFPADLEEAAMIDGANPWATFWRVVAPNSLGIVGAVGTITFIGSWNAFLWPLLVARENTRTVQVTLSQFMTSQGVNYPVLFTGALVAIIPVVGVFLFLQRYLVEGVETSGMK